MYYLLTLIGLVIGAKIGIKFADIDRHFPEWLLHHRAFLTHGAIIPMLLASITTLTQIQLIRGFTIGFCVTNAVHLSFDLFPKSWRGYALIHVFDWSLPPVASWLWISLGILVSLLIAYILWRNFLDIIVTVGSIIFGFSVYAHEGIWFPAIAFFTSAILAVSAASLFFPSVGNRKL
ncbi:hypothetical protein [Geitlerinema sp. PCC 9228]|jgi:hypothetical protein|uniref:hypothetical protein n=1 Tax=Geitlerinema sp. PCC 9228 TaxID=111611 RepID=UPI0008F9CA6B|nr:hypothetical protein [Geitlerinema sp. PCC 9228]